MPKDKNVVALGFFDGVHIGHAALLNMVNTRAGEIGATPAVLGFDTHPDTIVFGKPVELINSARERADIIKRYFGIEKLLFIHFDRDVMRMDWRDFIRKMTDELDAVHFVVGEDFRFGYKGEGTAEKLKQYSAELGLGCDIIAPVTLDGVTASSTYIRQLLSEGDVERANRFLGHPHTLIDTVRSGYQRGRTIDAPTVNMIFPDGVLAPRYGVYAAKVFIGDKEYPAVTNIGIRPTFAGEKNDVSVESFILGFSGDLYGQELRVEFYSFIRPEMKFSSVDALKEQIARDVETTKKFFNL